MDVMIVQCKHRILNSIKGIFLRIFFLFLESVRGFVVEEESETQAVLKFEAKISSNVADTSHSLVKLYTKTVKDAAGLYVVLKSYNKGQPGR